MLLTLALVILGASIAVFFSQEFLGMFKKIFAIKGVKLFLPLLIASWLVFGLDYSVLWLVYYYREFLEFLLSLIVSIIPMADLAVPIASVIILFTLSILPVFLLDVLVRKKSYKGYQYPHITSIFLFIISAILLLAL